MKCPYCGSEEQRVLDSRDARGGYAIRRRRECEGCSRRFSTYEEWEKPRLFVVKRDGSRQEFEREKLLKSMILASGKRPVPVEQLEAVASKIELQLHEGGDDEVPSQEIGHRVMEVLEGIDSIAYIRYASVYEQFDSPQEFTKFVKLLSPRRALNK